jgi:LCP family protein required for cell wall assembly
MSDPKDPEQERRAYTGETIVMREQPKPGAPPQGGPAPQHRPDQVGQPRRPDPSSRPQPQRRPATYVRPAPRRSLWPRVRLALLGLLGLLLLGVALTYWQISSLASAVAVRDVRPDRPLLGSSGGLNLLIVGVDERPDHPDEGVRSDTLILAHLDTGGRWASLLSIPRDSLVELPEIGPTKINVAYGAGYADPARYGAAATPREAGLASAAQTVEQFLGMQARGQRVDYVAQVNFDGFAQIIDALGGVTINVPARIVDDEYPTPDFGTQRIEFEPGVQRMDGARALIYARTRHADSDFDRSARQQQVLRAIITELRARGPVGIALLLPRLRSGLQGTVATTLPFARPDLLVGLLWLASGLSPDELGQVRLSPEIDPNMQQDAAFNLVWSPAGLQAALDAWLTRPSIASESARVQVLNATGVSGLAGRVTGELEQSGFAVLPADNAPASDAQRTIVYDITNKPRTSRRLAELLHAELRQGAPPDLTSEADIVVVLGKDAVK